MAHQSERDDDWYESEESTRRAMVVELQRIRRRTAVRPLPVIALALIVTTVITYKIATRAQAYYAEVVLAIREGSLGPVNKSTGLPMGELRELVTSVLLPDARIAELIERHDLHPLRRTLGMPWAINEVRTSLAVEVWRNSFVYYDPEAPNRYASVRVGLTYVDDDPDRAFAIAKDLAAIVISEVREHRLRLTRDVESQIAAMRAGLQRRMDALEYEQTERMIAHARALTAGKLSLAQAIHLRLLEIDKQQAATQKSLSEIATSQDALAFRIAEAGLDFIVEVVSERRPERPASKGLLILMVAVVVGVGAFFGAALVVGAFDSRVHELDDVARLGIPALGHVPGFPGDRIGSLEARGVQRVRLPLFRRWRSHR